MLQKQKKSTKTRHLRFLAVKKSRLASAITCGAMAEPASITMGGNTVNAPYKDKVAIHSVSNTTLERFKRNYGVLTEEQKQAAAKKLEEEAGKTTIPQPVRK
jgi:hypothetical protein